MRMMEELRARDILPTNYVPRIYCKAFEDNSGALELARTPKLRPRTKFINCKYHHFRSFVESGKIKLYSVRTEEQLADLFTKPLGPELFHKFTEAIFGWRHPNISTARGSVTNNISTTHFNNFKSKNKEIMSVENKK